MLKIFTLFIFKMMGWKLQGQIPAHINKCILVGAPHTSNVDYFLGMAVFYKLNFPFRYLMKQEWLNVSFLKKIFIKSGALGVERSKSNTMVDTIAELIATSKENMIVVISPEGTRKLVQKWKTGFYYIALKARIPIVIGKLDYAKKIADIGPSFMPCGCFRRDMLILKNYYKDIVPKFPEKFSLDIYEPDKNAICPV